MPHFPPRRIVCLTEETVETLYLLGEQDRIVGVSGYAVRPARVRKEKPRVSAFTSADIAAPDIILASWCGKKVVADKIRRRPKWNEVPAIRHDRIVEIKSPLILQPGPAALTDGLDAIMAALGRI
jgi:iron complex transport system substrate-binding protein